MSGICGIVNFDGAPVDPELLKRMAEAVAYRGPDGINYWVEGNVGLAHLALHTTPEATSERQPLVNERGDFVLVADARVDNRDELIHVLTIKGYLNKNSPNDAELILAAYGCWGEGCPKYIIGDYAFSIWNRRDKNLFCVRDALGVKPLHYCYKEAFLCFSSEAKQILQHPWISKKLDEIALARFLVSDISEPHRTYFKDVNKLLPGSGFTASHSGLKLNRYWDLHPSTQIHYYDENEYSEHFLEIFERSVSDRLRSRQENIGILMSGGLDSGSIAAVAQRLALTKNKKIKAYTYSFKTLEACSEYQYTEAMKNELGIEIEYLDVESFGILENSKTFHPDLESPFFGWGCVQNQIYDIIQQQNIQVVFSGHGGDSLISGTSYIYLDKFLQGDFGILIEIAREAKKRGKSYWFTLFKPIIPAMLQKRIENILNYKRNQKETGFQISLDENFTSRFGLLDKKTNYGSPQKSRSYAWEYLYDGMVNLGNVDRAVYFLDRTAAKYGLEERHPYLDRRIAEYVFAIPQDQLYKNRVYKNLLRSSMVNILPEHVRLRTNKTSFGDFLGQELIKSERLVYSILFDESQLQKLRIIDIHKLRNLYKNLGERAMLLNSELWYIIMVELWLKEHSGIFV